MKKILFVFAAAMMMTAFASCGQKTAAAANGSDSATVDSIEIVDSIVAASDSVVTDSTLCND